jgi:ubiquinone/menaquinone biosynthesis C-methylase UbiE
MRAIRTWWEIFKAVGNGMRAGRQTDRIFRYFTIKALRDLGMFDYLKEPRTFPEILSRFDFQDSQYVNELFSLLVHDKEAAIIVKSEKYLINKDFNFPDFKEILEGTDPRYHIMSDMAEVMSKNIKERMKEEKLGLQQVFERDNYELVNMFNHLLGEGPYSAIRSGCFAFLTKEDRRWLEGKRLLDVGCGNGQETAEIWVHMKGKTKIEAIDAVPGMLKLAEKQFETMVGKLDPSHPPISDENKPIFKLGNAVELPYEDNSYDAAFYSIMLHWTSNPAKAIAEMVRVVRPGGLIFGAQAYKPLVNPYMDIVIRSSRNSYGFFWKEDYFAWYRDCGQRLELITPAGIDRVRVEK